MSFTKCAVCRVNPAFCFLAWMVNLSRAGRLDALTFVSPEPGTSTQQVLNNCLLSGNAFGAASAPWPPLAEQVCDDGSWHRMPQSCPSEGRVPRPGSAAGSGSGPGQASGLLGGAG